MRLSLLFLLILSISSGCGVSSNKQEQQTDFKEKGREISSLAGSTLKKELMQAFKVGGIELAIPYCNTRAEFITDSLSQENKVRISRISKKNRSSKNYPEDSELSLIELFEKGELFRDTLINLNDVSHYYRPIFIEDNCLKCHGENIESKSEEIIAGLYPNDKAKGYKTGDFRGLWKISFVQEIN